MSRRHRTWVEVLVPMLIILALFTLTLIWNIVAAFVVLFIGLAVWLTRFIQRHQPPQPGG
ncbi:MAG TPA: hypothetical protein VF158_00460 [Longimicrobiales bacterium]